MGRRIGRTWKVSGERAMDVRSVPGAEARPLTGEEAAVLRWVLKHCSEEAREYLPQVEGLLANSWCPCGCPSIELFVADGVVAKSHGTVIGDVIGRSAAGEFEWPVIDLLRGWDEFRELEK